MEASRIDPVGRARASSSDVVTVIREDGSADSARAPEMSRDALRRFYVGLARTRRFEERLAALVREGRVQVWPNGRGLEAAVVGAVAALDPRDHVFPTPYDLGAFVYRGVSAARILDDAFANARSSTRGRVLPGQGSARRERIASVGALSGRHLSHAVGCAWAARIARDPIASLAFADESAVPSADFHTALNFAGVLVAGAVLVVRNRGGAPVAPKGVAYGVPGVRADGTDALAVLAVVREAREKAASGKGATLVELVLRHGAPDPVARLRRHVEHVGAWSPADEEALARDTDRELDEAVASAESAPAPTEDDRWQR